jgi:hypothetical protein
MTACNVSDRFLNPDGLVTTLPRQQPAQFSRPASRITEAMPSACPNSGDFDLCENVRAYSRHERIAMQYGVLDRVTLRRPMFGPIDGENLVPAGSSSTAVESLGP